MFRPSSRQFFLVNTVNLTSESELMLTGRYGQNRLPVDQRLCESCGVVEDEYHVLMDCEMYRDIRHNLFNEITTVELDFREQSIDTQFLEILSNPRYYRSVSKAMHLILNKRRDVMLR